MQWYEGVFSREKKVVVSKVFFGRSPRSFLFFIPPREINNPWLFDVGRTRSPPAAVIWRLAMTSFLARSCSQNSLGPSLPSRAGIVTVEGYNVFDSQASAVAIRRSQQY